MNDTITFQIVDIISDDVPNDHNVKSFLLTIYGIDQNNDRVVLHVKNKMTLEKSALKIINKDNLSKRALAILKNESRIMKSMQHFNVVKFKHIYENQRFLMIEMEYIPGG